MTPTAQYINGGMTMKHTPSGADLAAGSVVVVNDTIGINNLPILDGVEGILQLSGEFELPKDAATAFAAGVTVYWDVSAQEITETATDNEYFGKVKEAAAADATTVRCLLIP